MLLPGLSANFNEPQSDDPTSTPPMPGQQPQQPAQGQAQGLADALARRKKKGLIGPSVKPPSALAAAIAKAKRTRVGGEQVRLERMS
jgi:hypothetical protein